MRSSHLPCRSGVKSALMDERSNNPDPSAAALGSSLSDGVSILRASFEQSEEYVST